MKAALPRIGVPIALCLAAALASCSTQPRLDLVIRGGTLYDGTGQGSRRADVGVTGDRIVAIGDLSGRQAAVTIDATGKAVAPGFIDAHGRSGVALLADGYGESHLRQGITSEIIADQSPAFWATGTADTALAGRYAVALDWQGLAGYFDKLEARGTAINVGTLVPVSIARAGGGGAAFVDAAMRAGALGVVDDAPATGGSPAGDPGTGSGASQNGDLAAMVSAAGRYNGVFMAPMTGAVPAADRAMTIIANGAGARAIVITELTAMTPPDPATGSAVVQALAAATQRGVVVYGVGAPYPDAPGASDAAIRQAFRQWSLIVGTNSAAAVQGSPGSGANQGSDPPGRAAFGAFPRLLGQWTRDDHVLELADAIRRITSVPASLFDLPLRGIVREQYFADLVVFDPAVIIDRSSDQKPDEYPAGITHVIVNGVVTLAPDGLSGARAGRRLLGAGARRRPS
jgi:N-acyl-D-amino-acid deacylase